MHPIASVLNHGIPVCLCSDDPSAFGNLGLSFDFYQVLVSSEQTGLITLGEIALDSLKIPQPPPRHLAQLTVMLLSIQRLERRKRSGRPGCGRRGGQSFWNRSLRVGEIGRLLLFGVVGFRACTCNEWKVMHLYRPSLGSTQSPARRLPGNLDQPRGLRDRWNGELTCSASLLLRSRGTVPTAAGLNCAVKPYSIWPVTCTAGPVTCARGGPFTPPIRGPCSGVSVELLYGLQDRPGSEFIPLNVSN